ncbi:hypothetical protein SLEP1_g26580 [Rubroshorea leprosula]|uniref:Uncharacterized protein n=1 Tax=Rubroshorea leprosula TaxID=152421 RepID=A0AAV5JSZ2_9ROSI|nr:hypothetical protein SLEP1_g26580 [Rubroshorea leprosula]
MATTPLLFTSSGHAAEKPEQGKNRGRKPSKAQVTQKKLPQRGMGVEKLERLRLQERWNKMTEEEDANASQLGQSGAVSYGSTAPYPITHFAGPSESTVPMLLGAASFGVPTVNGGGRGEFWGWDMGMMVQQRVGNGGGFSGFVGGQGSGQILGLVEHSHLGSRVGASDFRVQFGSVFETSRELSSMPNLQQYVPAEYRSDVYFKKKRLNVGNTRLNGGFNGISPVLPINGGQIFPGLHLQNNQYLNEGQIQINGFSQRQIRGPSAGYSSSHTVPGFQLENNTQNFNRDNQMNGLTLKGPRTSTATPYYSCQNPYEGTGSQVLVEYDFFPRASSRSTSSKVEASVAEALRGEASDPNSTYVDLSLKL